MINHHKTNIFLLVLRNPPVTLKCRMMAKPLRVSATHWEFTGQVPTIEMRGLLTNAWIFRNKSGRKRKHDSVGCLPFVTIYNPPTPAFAKAGAAPGTTAGVELVFLGSKCFTAWRQLRSACPLSPLPSVVRASMPAVFQPSNP